MNKSSAILAALLGLGLGTAQANIDAIDNVPAATLLLPHFQVDTANSNGVRTVFTIGNSGAAEQLAHVTVWSDRGVPVFNFDVRLAARDVAEINLRELIVNGVIPSSTAGSVPGCGGLLPPTNLTPTQITGLRNALTGQPSSLVGGQCGSTAHGDAIARGFITVDATNSCSTLVPGDSGYFLAGGTGIASNNNVLWGETSTFNPMTAVAFGDALVHIEASASDPATNGPDTLVFDNPDPMMPDVLLPDYTFYRRIVDENAIPLDNREGLPQMYFGRYSLSGAISGTHAEVWRDPGNAAPFACASPPAGLTTQQTVVWDHQEQITSGPAPVQLPLATQSVDLGDPGATAIPHARGVLYYNLGLSSGSGALLTRNQGHVSHVLTSSESAGQNGSWPYGPITMTPYLMPVFASECSDGIDNDMDGDIDFPEDSTCTSPDTIAESTQCSDGIDNDLPPDGVSDFPNDPGCASANDNNEDNTFANICSDGLDNDNDGEIDWPTDNGCAHPNDNTEFFGQCDDGVENDMPPDGQIDFPNDLGCTGPTDGSEANPQCIDGISNDADGLIDFPADPGCQSANSNNEAPACDDDIDNDLDGPIDFPADVGCAAAYSTTEAPQCSDGVNNDAFSDALIDFPNDPGCTSPSDTTEFETQCSDGIDNDSDGDTDFPNSPGCSSAGDDIEAPDCSDVDDSDPMNPMPIDNDLDGLANFPTDPGCASALDQNELSGSTTRECSDGIDNDLDGFIDFGSDAQCSSAYDDVEYGQGQLILAPTEPVPTLSVWGLALLASLFARFGIYRARRGVIGHE